MTPQETLEEFIFLTQRTLPHPLIAGTLEQYLLDLGYVNENENFFMKIGESETMFTSNFDTASSESVHVQHVIDGRFVRTDGKSILGADDKAGMLVMANMIRRGIPGLYCVFYGEERGGLGSSAVTNDERFKKYKRCISFDRRGYHSIITSQSCGDCCSLTFANALSDEFARQGMFLMPDDTGVFTDSANFIDVVPECTNISVGYFREHTASESQDILYLTVLANAVVKIDWENLPTERVCQPRSYHKHVKWLDSSFDSYDYTPSVTAEYHDLAQDFIESVYLRCEEGMLTGAWSKEYDPLIAEVFRLEEEYDYDGLAELAFENEYAMRSFLAQKPLSKTKSSKKNQKLPF